MGGGVMCFMRPLEHSPGQHIFQQVFPSTPPNPRLLELATRVRLEPAAWSDKSCQTLPPNQKIFKTEFAFETEAKPLEQVGNRFHHHLRHRFESLCDPKLSLDLVSARLPNYLIVPGLFCRWAFLSLCFGCIRAATQVS